MDRKPTDISIHRYAREEWPDALESRIGDLTPSTVTMIGSPDILHGELLGLFCSQQVPGNLILKAYDWAREARDRNSTVISGFHSPIEKDCLEILLQGTCPIIVCPARGLGKMRVPRAWREPISRGRLLVLSIFPDNVLRMTAKTCELRNRLVVHLADEILFIHVRPDGKTDALRRWAAAQRKSILQFEGQGE